MRLPGWTWDDDMQAWIGPGDLALVIGPNTAGQERAWLLMDGGRSSSRSLPVSCALTLLRVGAALPNIPWQWECLAATAPDEIQTERKE